MKWIKRVLCLILTVIMVVSSGFPDISYAETVQTGNGMETGGSGTANYRMSIPDMAKEAHMDITSYIMQNLNSSMVSKVTAYSEKELENVDEDSVVVNLGDGNLTTIDQVENSGENTALGMRELGSSMKAMFLKLVSASESAMDSAEVSANGKYSVDEMDIASEKDMASGTDTVAVTEKDTISGTDTVTEKGTASGTDTVIEKGTVSDRDTIVEKDGVSNINGITEESAVNDSVPEESIVNNDDVPTEGNRIDDEDTVGEERNTEGTNTTEMITEVEIESTADNTESSAEQSSTEEDASEEAAEIGNGNSLIPTVHSILINYSLADAGLVKDGVTTVNIWDDTPEAFLASYSVTATLYAMEGNDDCFVAFINPGGMNGRADCILDATFTDTDSDNPINYTDVVKFDKNTGIAYIPKSIYFNEAGEEIPYDLMTQVLVGYDMDQEYNGINVFIENQSGDVDAAAEEQVIQGMSLDIKTTIPLTTPETAKNLDLEKVNIFVNGNAAPASFNSNEYYFNRETGELTVALAPITVYSLRITIEGTTLAEKAGGIAKKLSNLIVMESFAQTTTPATSVDDIKVLPYGTIHITTGVKVGQLFKKNVKMKYIANMSNASDSVKEAIYKVYEYCYYNYADNEYGRREYGYAKNGGTIQDYLDDPGFGHLENSDENRTAFSLFNFFLKTPTGTSTATTDSNAKMTFNIKSDIDYLVLHCCENITAADAIDSITPTGGWQDSELWFRVLALTDNTIILGICGPRCTTQAAYGVFAISLDISYSFNMKIKKASDNTSITSNNELYALKGAEYTLYEGFYGDAAEGSKTVAAWKDKTKIGTYTTNSNGNITIKDLEFTPPSYVYFIKETKAPAGFDLDPTIYSFHSRMTSDNKIVHTILRSEDNGRSFHNLDYFGDGYDRVATKTINNGDSVTLDSLEPPLNHSFALILQKMDADTEESVAVGTASMEGALFQMEYYNNTKGDTSGEAFRTWVFKTDRSGKLYFSKEAYLNAELSDELYKEPGTGVVYPLGTYLIKEIQPPQYYQLAGTMKFTNSNASNSQVSVTEGLKLVIAKGNDGEAHIYGADSIGSGAISASNLALNVYDESYKGKIKVIKYDNDGKTLLAGVSFKLIGDNGEEYTGTTDQNGEIVFEELVPQHYVLSETATVEGHTLLQDDIDITIPLEMTEKEAKAQNADLSEAVWDEQAQAYCFYEVTYEVSNSTLFDVPAAGGNPVRMYLFMVIACMMIGGGMYAAMRNRKIR